MKRSATASSTEEVIIHTKKTKKQPENWQTVYDKISAFRQSNPAPIDTMGCERLANSDDPKAFRYQTLVSLQLSSQTRDAITADAVRKLQALPMSLTPQTVMDMSAEELAKILSKVSFHNRKAMYLKESAKMIMEEFGGDIPDTVEGLMRLKGVGEKMAYLCMQAAWFKLSFLFHFTPMS